MSWDLAAFAFDGSPPPPDIVSEDWSGESMGRPADVIALLDSVFPKIEWAGPMVLDGGLSFSEGYWEFEELMIEFFVTEKDPVRVLEMGVRGSGDPIPHLNRLRKATRWWILDAGNEEWLDDSGSGWNAFQSILRDITGGN